MDKRSKEIEKFKQARIDRLKALREQERQSKITEADQARKQQLKHAQELETYKILKQKQEVAERDLNKLAYEYAYQNLPTAEDTAIAELFKKQLTVNQKREKQEKAELVCKQNQQLTQASLKQKYDDIQRNREEKLARKLALEKNERERSKKAVLRQKTIDEERKNYQKEQEIYENSVSYKIQKAQGKSHISIEKHPGIPVQKFVREGFVEIVPEFNVDFADDDFLAADAYSEAVNFKENLTPKVFKKFNVERMNQQHRTTSQAQEALNILEMIQKM